MPALITHNQWSQVSARIAESMGLYFPPERLDDLERGVGHAAQELGFDTIAVFLERFLSGQPTTSQVDMLANHLTIGETYFFRDKKTIDEVREYVLTTLVHSRRGGNQQLRIWSAACSTGEEAYSLAILLHQLLPDLPRWRVTILATDINGRFLQKAAAGVYGEWSFRNTPAGFRERYFVPVDGAYAVLPEIKNMVTFKRLNLVEDVYPSIATNTHEMDLIFCRNALMYFTAAQAEKTVRNFHSALVEDGCLVVSPVEASARAFPQFVPVSCPSVTLFKKAAGKRVGTMTSVNAEISA